MKRTAVVSVLAAAVFAVGVAHAVPISGTFNYQGRLTSGGAPITGNADVKFILWDAEVGGNQSGPVLTFLNVPVTGGLFAADLDFGVAVFNGEKRWLQIDVRSPAGVGSYVTLGRQQVLGTPYAIQTRGLFVDDVLNVGVGTTAPQAKLHVGGDAPSLLVKNEFGSPPSGLLIDGNDFYRITSYHPTDGNPSAVLVDGSYGGQWQAFDREGGGAGGIVSATGSAAISGDGFVELFGRDTGSPTVLMLADGNSNSDDNEYGYLLLGSAGATGQGGTLSIRNNSGYETLSILGGGSGQCAALDMFDLAGNSIYSIGEDSGSCRVGTYDSVTGNYEFLVSPDTSSGGGGILKISRNDAGDYGLIVEGNYGGLESANVYISGAGSTTSFWAETTGNSSVNLPNNAIGDYEILDEPGVAGHHAGSTAIGSSGYTTLISRSITVPASGYVLALAQGDLYTYHYTGTTSNYQFGVSDVTGALPSDQDIQVTLPSVAPTGGYDFPAPAHGLFSVSTAGTYTFYFNARKYSGAGSGYVYDLNLTLVYFPTAYGTVTSTLLTRDSNEGNDLSAPPSPGLTPADIKAEQFEAVAFDQARRDAEFAEMQALVAQMQERMAEMEHRLDRATHHANPDTPAPATAAAGSR